MYGPGSYSYSRPRKMQPVRKGGPIHILIEVRQDNEVRWVPACGMWGQTYRTNSNGDQECLACIKKAP